MAVDAILTPMGAAGAAVIDYISAHTADPTTVGDSLAAPKVACTVSYAAGDFAVDAETTTDAITPGVTVTHHGLWAGATFIRGVALASSVAVADGQAYRWAAGAVVATLADVTA